MPSAFRITAGHSARRPLGLCLLLSLLLSLTATAADAAPPPIRQLFSFENETDLAQWRAAAGPGAALDVVQDNGVTHGRNCLRLAAKPGDNFVTVELKGDCLKDWSRYDYLAVDVYTDRPEKLPITMELWDRGAQTGNYADRATWEDGKRRQTTRQGRTTLLWQINRAVRNGKTGLEWEQQKPEFKIDLAGLTLLKLFFKPLPQGDTVLWIDNVRLLTEDAVGGRIQVALPAGAVAFDFGNPGSATPGFTTVSADTPGVSGPGVSAAGATWPDPLTGDGLESAQGTLALDLPVPTGNYRLWLCAVRRLDPHTLNRPYRLKVGATVLCDETWTDRELYSLKGVYRHMDTQFSRRPDALWLDCVLPVAPEFRLQAAAVDGKLHVEVSNFRLTALVAVPAADPAAFDRLCADLRAQRLKIFNAQNPVEPLPALEPQPGDGPYLLWIPAFEAASGGSGGDKPDALRKILPASLPTPAERQTAALDWHATPGERIVARVCLTAFTDLGQGTLALSDLTSAVAAPTTPAPKIPASALRAYRQTYRLQDGQPVPAQLLPAKPLHCEAGLTWCYWLWFQVPANAAPGSYTGQVTFTPEHGQPRALPVKLEVYPFHLDDNLPCSYGFNFMPMPFPAFVDGQAKLKEQFQFMRELGLTGVEIDAARVTALGPNHTVTLEFDPTLYTLAKEVGMARNPRQRLRTDNDILPFARQIGRLMGLGKEVDLSPGIEFTRENDLKPYFQDAIRQYAGFLKQTGLPVAALVVDEPRGMPNPWNRNPEQTIKYCDWAREAGGVTTFVDFAGDFTHDAKGNDQSLVPLLSHIDIVDVHAYKSAAQMIAEARRTGQTLWFYNTGRDRLSWGFYAWKMQAEGRWEWHWFFTGDITTPDGYPTPTDWYSPFAFNPSNAVTPAPPADFPGGITFDPSLLDLSRGVTDRLYLHTLETALQAAANDPAKAATVQQARDFLAAVRAAIPDLPTVKGLASNDAGALVGEGLNSTAAGLCEPWRQKIAALLIALQAP